MSRNSKMRRVRTKARLVTKQKRAGVETTKIGPGKGQPLGRSKKLHKKRQTYPKLTKRRQ